MIKVQVTDSGVVDAFNRLITLGERPYGALVAIGEEMLQFTKTRFEKSVDPYGEPWEVNTDATLRALLHSKSDVRAAFSHLGSRKEGSAFVAFKRGYFKKDGSLSKKSQNLLSGKKPLIGESKSLSTQFGKAVIGDSAVTVTSTMKYAAMQQFGGSKSDFPNLWSDIPARPFFPDADRGLPDELSQAISDVLRDAIQGAIDG